MTEILTRAEQSEDIATIRLIVIAAFGQSNEADLIDRLRKQGHLHASSVAVVDGQLTGHAALSRGSVSGQGVLILAPVSVSP